MLGKKCEVGMVGLQDYYKIPFEGISLKEYYLINFMSKIKFLSRLVKIEGREELRLLNYT